MSDSESDDDLLNPVPTFSRSNKRAETKKRQRESDFFDNMFNDLEKEHQSAKRLSFIKKEHQHDEDEDELIRRSEQLTHSTSDRQSIKDTLDGLDLYQDSALDRKEHAKRRDAIESGAHVSLGALKMISFDERRSKRLVKFFHTLEEAVGEFRSILEGSSSKLGLDALQNAIDAGEMESLLNTEIFLALLNKCDTPSLRNDLTVWLYRVACSAGLDASATRLYAFAGQACATLLELYELKRVSDFCLSSLECFCQSLECFLEPSTTKPVSVGNDMVKPTNMPGLCNLLQLWTVFLPHCDLPLRDSTATTVVGLLCRLLVDQHVFSRDMSCERLSSNLFPVLVTLLDVVYQANKDNRDQLVDWYRTSAEKVCEVLINLASHSSMLDDNDDSCEWLPLARMVALFPSPSAVNSGSPATAEFHLTLAMVALEKLLDVPDLPGLVQTTLVEESEFLENALASQFWRGLASVFCALKHIRTNKDKMIDNASRCLAIVICATYALKAAWNGWKTVVLPGSGSMYGGKQMAKTVAHTLTLLLAACEEASSSISKFATKAHIRRSEALLSDVKKYLSTAMDAAKSEAGLAARQEIQQDVRHYFKSETLCSP